MGQSLRRLLNALDIAAHFDKHIYWSKYQLLFSLVSEEQLSVDFVRDVLIYGLHLRPRFEVPATTDRKLKRMYGKIFGAAERQMYFLETHGHSLRVSIRKEWDCWLRRYTGGDEVIFKDFGPGLPECGQIKEKGASEDTIEKESHLNE